MLEVLTCYKEKIEASRVLERLGLAESQFFLVSSHREENVDLGENLTKLVDMLNRVAEMYDLPLIVSTHPRTQKRIDETGAKLHRRVHLLKPLGFSDYVHLETRARAVLSDSGTITEESSILNFPALNIREAHERPEGMEEASVMMVGLHATRVLQALEILGSQPRGEKRLLRSVADYTVPNVSDKVLRIILSYTDYVNRNVWRRPP